MSDIFISYASADRAKAEALAHGLEQEGWSVWWDRTIPSGKKFDQVIEEALAAARCVLVLWSANSVASDWVKEEAEEALKRNILVPIFIEKIIPPMGFRRVQAADLAGWTGSTVSPIFQKLVGDIAAVVGLPKVVAPEAGAIPAPQVEAIPAPEATATGETEDTIKEQFVDQEEFVSLPNLAQERKNKWRIPFASAGPGRARLFLGALLLLGIAAAIIVEKEYEHKKTAALLDEQRLKLEEARKKEAAKAAADEEARKKEAAKAAATGPRGLEPKTKSDTYTQPTVHISASDWVNVISIWPPVSHVLKRPVNFKARVHYSFQSNDRALLTMDFMEYPRSAGGCKGNSGIAYDVVYAGVTRGEDTTTINGRWDGDIKTVSRVNKLTEGYLQIRFGFQTATMAFGKPAPVPGFCYSFTK